jgi:N-acetylglucosaminyldiphosphoundecaprenol N-acetyl-beta-D-mannosaminyltransferase
METNAAAPARKDLFGLPFDPLTMTQAMDRCRTAIQGGSYLSVGVVNAAKLMSMQRDLQLREAVTGCDMILADGQSVVWASRILRTPLPQRVAGIDLFLELLADAAQKAYRVYFLGARKEVLNRMLQEITDRFPGLQVAGARDGYFRPEDELAVVEEIRDAGADLLFVGISSPKKELFLNRWGKATNVHVVHGVGGSFDVLAGLTTRAPLWWQRKGLEWLYRALQEPVRLGPRYLKTNMSFMTLVAREAVRQRPARRMTQVTAQRTVGADAPAAQTMNSTRNRGDS